MQILSGVSMNDACPHPNMMERSIGKTVKFGAYEVIDIYLRPILVDIISTLIDLGFFLGIVEY